MGMFGLLKSPFELQNVILDTKSAVWFSVYFSSQTTFSFFNSCLCEATLTCFCVYPK